MAKKPVKKKVAAKRKPVKTAKKAAKKTAVKKTVKKVAVKKAAPKKEVAPRRAPDEIIFMVLCLQKFEGEKDPVLFPMCAPETFETEAEAKKNIKQQKLFDIKTDKEKVYSYKLLRFGIWRS